MIGEESEEENALSFSKDTLDEVPEEEVTEPVEEPKTSCTRTFYE